jgi:hypothetical protein
VSVYHPSFWRRHFFGQFIPALEHLISTLESRLLPNFQDSDIGYEADAVVDEVWQQYMSLPATGDEDPSNFAEAAREAGLDHYTIVTGIRQGIINMFAAGLYHAYEQQFLFFHREELLPYEQQHDHTQLKVSIARKLLSDRGIEITSFQTWPLIEELRLVSNTVKHAEGESANQLRLIRPDIFEDPALKEFAFEGPTQLTRRIRLPMVGEDLFVQMNDLLRYRDALIQFWRDLSDSLEKSN